MATTSQELNINHTCAKESKDVGEEIGGGVLVTSLLYGASQRHNQLPPRLFLLKQKGTLDKKTNCCRFHLLISPNLGGFDCQILLI